MRWATASTGSRSGRSPKGLVLAPGRGLWQAEAEVQIATVSEDPSAEAQAAAIVELATQVESPTTPWLRGGARSPRS